MHTLFIESIYRTRSPSFTFPPPSLSLSLSLWFCLLGLKNRWKYAILIHSAIPHENMFKPFLSARKTFAYRPVCCVFIPFQTPSVAASFHSVSFSFCSLFCAHISLTDALLDLYLHCQAFFSHPLPPHSVCFNLAAFLLFLRRLRVSPPPPFPDALGFFSYLLINLSRLCWVFLLDLCIIYQAID